LADRNPPLGVAFLLAVLLLPGVLLANGGTLRFLGLLGPWEVAVFTDPTPLRPDSLDVSVLVTLPGNPRPVEGLSVLVTVRPASGGEVVQPASREAADDPRYYAAKFMDLGVGEVAVSVAVSGPGEPGGEASFTLEAREPGIMEHPAVLFLLALLPLAGVGWWLRRGRSPMRAGGPPGPGRG